MSKSVKSVDFLLQIARRIEVLCDPNALECHVSLSTYLRIRPRRIRPKIAYTFEFKCSPPRPLLQQLNCYTASSRTKLQNKVKVSTANLQLANVIWQFNLYRRSTHTRHLHQCTGQFTSSMKRISYHARAKWTFSRMHSPAFCMGLDCFFLCHRSILYLGFFRR